LILARGAQVKLTISAEGESVVNDIGQIERGYEQLIKKLTALGADIKYSE